jgi:hypothetical protein
MLFKPLAMLKPKVAQRAGFPVVLEAIRQAAEDENAGRASLDRAAGRLYAALDGLASMPAGAPATLYPATLYNDAGHLAGDDDYEIPGLEKVPGELALTDDLTPDSLHRIRREFALKNHPDRVPPRLRELATQRMVAANALIDQALARCQGTAR